MKISPLKFLLFLPKIRQQMAVKWIFGFLVAVQVLQAQPELPKKKFTIAPVLPKANSNPTPSGVAPSIFSPKNYNEKSNPINYSLLDKIREKQAVEPKETFMNPAQDVEDRLNGANKEVAMGAKGDQYFGEFRNNGKFVRIICRDHEYPDGDRVSVLLNGVRVISNITLESSFQEVNITLIKGFNKIDFEALNQGTSGPNTAEFIVYDDKGNLISSNKWNLSTGYKATVIVVKEWFESLWFKV